VPGRRVHDRQSHAEFVAELTEQLRTGVARRDRRAQQLVQPGNLPQLPGLRAGVRVGDCAHDSRERGAQRNRQQRQRQFVGTAQRAFEQRRAGQAKPDSQTTRPALGQALDELNLLRLPGGQADGVSE
jgi:hypothetical protein